MKIKLDRHQVIKRQSGFSLIELMIAMLIGLILMLGISSIFVSTTNNIRLQRGIANIQDSGRIAYDFMKNDITETGALYSSSVNIQIAQNGQMPQRSVTTFVVAPSTTYKGNDELARTNTLSATATTGGLFYGLPTASDVVTLIAALPAAAKPALLTNAYRISSRYFIQGHECTTVAACVPALTSAGAARTDTGATAATATAGSAVGSRVTGSDVLTIRRLVGNGASIASATTTGNPIYTLQAGALARLGLASVPAARLSERLVMIADVDRAAIYRGSFDATGATFTVSGAPTTDPGALGFDAEKNSRIFDMENQFLTITYYLQNIADPNVAGRVIPALMRRENGRDPEEIARGIERLDFRYKVGEFARLSSWVNANEVNAIALAKCPPLAQDTAETSCGWRDVTEVEVGFLANTIDQIQLPDSTVTYTMNQVNGVAAPVGEKTLRREFRFTVPIRAWQQ